MPAETITAVTAVLSMFAFFMSALLYADLTASRVPQPRRRSL